MGWLWAVAIAVALAFAAVYCLAVGPYWKITPDSTTYVLGAQSLAEGKGYQEAGHPAPLFPPGTSTLLSAARIVGRQTYRAMNAEVVLFAFASLAICFLLFRDSLGGLGSAAVVLMSLGSVEFFKSSTFLLSEMFFVFFSLLGLWCYRRDNTLGAVLSATSAVLVRTVGISLAAALVLDCMRQRPRQWKRAVFYTLPLVVAGLWELRNRHLGWSYGELMTQNEPWNPASGHIPAMRLLTRVAGNLAYGPAMEDVITNGLTHRIGWTVIPGIILAGLLVLGFWRLTVNDSTSKQRAVIGLYFVLFSLTVALYWPSVVIRLLVPVLPLIFAFLVAGVQTIAQMQRFRWIHVAAVPFLALYIIIGFRETVPIAAENRTSPFPNQLVKYAGNDDMQRLALWWKDHTARDTYACQHPNIVDIIAEGAGVTYVLTGSPRELEERLLLKHARYLLLNLDQSQDRALASVAAHSENFRLVQQERHAAAYELTNWRPNE